MGCINRPAAAPWIGQHWATEAGVIIRCAPLRWLVRFLCGSTPLTHVASLIQVVFRRSGLGLRPRLRASEIVGAVRLRRGALPASALTIFSVDAFGNHAMPKLRTDARRRPIRPPLRRSRRARGPAESITLSIPRR